MKVVKILKTLKLRTLTDVVLSEVYLIHF